MLFTLLELSMLGYSFLFFVFRVVFYSLEWFEENYIGAVYTEYIEIMTFFLLINNMYLVI